VRRGEINLERLVEVLHSRDYITEQHQEEGCGFGSSAMEAVHQDDLKLLFSFFFPDSICDNEIQCAATDEGGEADSFAYVLFNTNIVTREAVIALLRAENEETYAWVRGKV
jgi:hypothetical protein